MIYCNESVLSRVGGRKAPKGGKDKLNELCHVDKRNGIPIDWKFRDFLTGCDWEDENGKNKVEFSKLSAKFLEDLKKVNVSTENNGDATFGTTKTGVDYITTWIAGDWELTVQIFIYWDGKHYRGYIPIKGNCVNVLNKSAFGNDEDMDEKYCQIKFKLSYEDVCYDLDIDFDKCLEDFESRIEVIDTPEIFKGEFKYDINQRKISYNIEPAEMIEEDIAEVDFNNDLLPGNILLTTPEQSLILLKSGIDIESADMLYRNPSSDVLREILYIDDNPEIKELLRETETYTKDSGFIPAWSISRMIGLYLKLSSVGLDKDKVNTLGLLITNTNNIREFVFDSLLEALR